ncbi:MAG: succinylglutamate desuccinylase/aspartoacylase family protein, partial [Alphaproteobacteria bacterium]|nr:succinylglutamate desuccinylase/aspartoacylase family protein [Alphaproteobacteria bacterium]
LTAPGLNLGTLRVPHSVHRSAYGHLPMQVASFVGKEDGPTVLLMAGNHGDEYEGQVILSDLTRTLDPSLIRGRLILLPMANFPAAEAGLRTSPLDDGNLNRNFPGRPLGSPTEMIAYYIEHYLIAGTDMVIDLHSGGSSLYCVPFAMTSWVEGNTHNSMRLKVFEALGLPFVLRHGPEANGWYSSSAAWRAGAAGFTLELGGGGTVDPVIRRCAQTGILRALAVAGSYIGPIEGEVLAPTYRDFPREDLIFAQEPGLYEPMVLAGGDAVAGQLAARIHFPETPGKSPLEVYFEYSGVVLAHRVPARVVRGDCLFHMGLE